MNCQSFENIVDDLAREQLIEARFRAEALRHIDECSTCATRLDEERNLTLNLRALAVEMSSVAAPAHVESLLLAAFNEQQVARQSRPRRSRYLSTAAAATLLVSLGIAIAAWNLSVPRNHVVVPKNTTVSANNSSTNEPKDLPEDPVETSVKRETPGLTVKRKPAAHRPARVEAAPTETVATASETEVASDFMPIGYVNSASLQDGGSVVRVELPRSTIVSLGFAVNMDRYGERVKADVLMGADGLARAIRFVQ
jgi:hypothetical protein